MIIVVLIAGAFLAYGFYLVHLLPLALYGKLAEYIDVRTGYSTCQACGRSNVSLDIVGQELARVETRTTKVLVREDKDWVPCRACGGQGVLGRNTSEQSPSHLGGERAVVRTFACEKCNGRGGSEEVVHQEFEDREKKVRINHYTIRCRSCRKSFVRTQENRPQIETPKRTFLAIAIQDGLMTGMVSGMLLAVAWYLYWGIGKLISNWSTIEGATDWITAIDAFLIVAIFSVLIGLVIGGLWGSMVTLAAPILSRFLDTNSYLYSAINGAVSLVMLFAFLDFMFEDFAMASYNKQTSGYVLAYFLTGLIGAAVFCGGKFLSDLLERHVN